MHQEYGWKYHTYHWICTDENQKQRLDHIKKRTSHLQKRQYSDHESLLDKVIIGYTLFLILKQFYLVGKSIE